MNKQLVLVIALLFSSAGLAQTPNNCNDYSSVGTTSYVYDGGSNATCNALVPGVVAGIGAWTGNGCSGVITTTVTGAAVSCITISYAYVNNNDFATITTDSGGALTITAVNCGVSGNVIGPYQCAQSYPYGNVSVTICSTLPFTSVILTNTGCESGWLVNCVDQSCDPSWNTPTPCSDDPEVGLDAYVTGDPGGTWSGIGVIGNAFDPSFGSQNVQYSAPCGQSLTKMINVSTAGNPSWTPPSNVCSTDPPIDLNTLLTGTAGGSWTGIGVSGSIFTPSVGSQSIIYTVGSVPCNNYLVQTIPVIAVANPNWFNPVTLCESGGVIDLDATILGTPGGSWSGNGVTGSSFDPTGLSGPITITYTVGAAPCPSSYSQDIDIITDVDANWVSPISLCDNSIPFDLNTTIVGTVGGIWSGVGVTGNMFDPSVGNQTLNYIVGIGTCSESLTQPIQVSTAPDPTWTTLTMCSSDAPINLNSQITGDPGGTWSGTGVTDPIFDPFFGTQNLTYAVTVGACSALYSQDLNVVQPQLTTSSMDVTCFGLSDGSLDVSVNGGSGFYIYEWNTSPVQSTSTVLNVSAGAYTVTVSDGACFVEDTIIINEPSPITGIMTRTNGCDPLLGSAGIIASGGVGGYLYTWNNSIQSTATITDLDSNMHTVLVTDVNGCTYTDSILVEIFQPPILTITTDTIIESGSEVQLNVSGGVTNQWNPIDYLDCSDCFNPMAYPPEDTYYCATVTDVNGCSNESCVEVKVVIVCGDVFVPSGFSPNDDGENDELCFYTDCMNEMTFSVFNRWGEKIYETNSTDICWDGTWQGEPLNTAVFVYIIEGTLINGETVSQQGNISLIR